MSFVTMNVLKVSDDRKAEFEDRFARRAAQVGQAEGFEAFELLRPAPGTDRYVVYTRWKSKEAFEGWVKSPAFAAGHAHLASGGPIGTDSEIWTFEVTQAEYAG